MSEQNLALVRTSYAGWNSHDATAWLKNFSDDVIFESQTLPKSPVKGHDGMRSVMQLYTSAFPDTHLAVVQEMASGSFVVTQVKATGTHRGELSGIPPTNRHVTLDMCFISECRNGKIVHSWSFWDTGALLRQLGVMPAQA